MVHNKIIILDNTFEHLDAQSKFIYMLSTNDAKIQELVGALCYKTQEQFKELIT